MVNLLDHTRKYLEISNQQRPLHTMTPEEVRAKRTKWPKVQLKNQVTLSTIKDQKIKVRDGEDIPIRIYTPIGEGPFPIIIYYHGGGWVLNDIDSTDATCQLLAARTKSIVISVGYRLAPEYKFPIPLYDAYDAFTWTVENSISLNGVQANITVMGDSAGGNLATVVTIMNKQLQGPTIAQQVLLYPVTDLSFSAASYLEFAEGYGLRKKDMEWFAHYYVNSLEERTNPYVAPLRANDLGQLPKALLVVAENDVLKDEGIAYAKKLKQSGTHVELHTAMGLVHSFFTKNDVFNNETEQMVSIINTFLNEPSN